MPSSYPRCLSVSLEDEAKVSTPLREGESQATQLAQVCSTVEHGNILPPNGISLLVEIARCLLNGDSIDVCV